MQHQHKLPFGAQIEGGETRFRLWAPAAGQVELLLESGHQPRVLAMKAREQGWYETLTPAPAGTRYRYRIDDGLAVPDPASRYQPEDVLGPSEVIAPLAWDWRDDEWRGRAWEEAVLYELHVGTFTPEGTFRGAIERIEHLRALG